MIYVNVIVNLKTIFIDIHIDFFTEKKAVMQYLYSIPVWNHLSASSSSPELL